MWTDVQKSVSSQYILYHLNIYCTAELKWIYFFKKAVVRFTLHHSVVSILFLPSPINMLLTVIYGHQRDLSISLFNLYVEGFASLYPISNSMCPVLCWHDAIYPNSFTGMFKQGATICFLMPWLQCYKGQQVCLLGKITCFHICW